MSNEAQAWASGIKTGSVTAKSILLRLANYADEDGSCFPSQERLASEVECSPRAVRKWLAIFEEKGLLKREERRRRNGYKTSDRIYLLINISPERGAGENGDLTGTQEHSHRNTGTLSPEPDSGDTKDESSGELKGEDNPAPQAEPKSDFQLRKEWKQVFDKFGMGRPCADPVLTQFRELWAFNCQREDDSAKPVFLAFAMMSEQNRDDAMEAIPFYAIAQERKKADTMYRHSLKRWIDERAWEGMVIPEADREQINIKRDNTLVDAKAEPELYEKCLSLKYGKDPQKLKLFRGFGMSNFPNEMVVEARELLAREALLEAEGGRTGTDPP